MKNSLFSLLILSMLCLSTQAIAQQVNLGHQDITIQGRVIQDSLTCTVQPIGAIQLENAYVTPSLKLLPLVLTPRKNFTVKFSGCANQGKPKKVKVVFQKKDTAYLENTGSAINDTNAQVELFNHTGRAISLNGEDTERTFVSEVVGDTGSLTFSLGYTSPKWTADGISIKPGNFNASLSFDAFVTDDIH
ncbi:fimbrial protein [Proteus mirabilis]|uniref:fimbrial protein n=1 Tax=Proteus mirabilis TaxID=584 RepID=UPI0020B7A637|nr:type 1 fimbrial protein [Proteus mirabilis]MDX4948756.1 type 1 fimbrial protein [Proteus mirabilis]